MNKTVTAARRVTLEALAILAVALLASMPAANADTPKPSGKIAPLSKGEDTELTRHLQQASRALKNGNLALALIELKNAVRLAPQNGAVRAQLGLVLLRAGDPATAERELRQARSDGGPDDVILPALFQSMFLRGKAKDLLSEFPDPGPNSKDKTTPDTLRARAIALQSLGQNAEANASMDRALALRRDSVNLLTRAQIARQQNDVALATRLNDEVLKKDPKNADALMLRLGLVRMKGDKQKALAEADRMVQMYPQSIAPRVARIEILLDLRQDAKARQEIDALLAQSPKLTVALYYKAMVLARAKDVKGAWQVVRDLPEEFIHSQPTIAIVVAQMAIDSGNHESGGKILTTLLSRSPDVPQARVRLAALRLRQNNAQAALTVLEPLKDSKDPQILALFADANLKLKRYDAAINYLERADISIGGNDLLKRQVALAELQAGKSAEGVEDLEALLARQPSDLRIVGPLLAAYVQQRKFNEALAVADKLAKSDPKSTAPEFYRGQILMVRGDLAGATAAFSRCLELDPNFTPARYFRSQVALARGEFEQADKDLQLIIAREPKSVTAFVKRAEIAARRGQDAQVQSLLKQAIAADRDNPTPRLVLANYHLIHKNYRDAQAALAELLQVSPQNVEALAMLGQVQYALGMKDQAVTTYRQLTNRVPQSASAQVLLAGVLAGTGDRTNAKIALQKAVALAPDSPNTRAQLISLELGGGAKEEALAIARAYAAAYPGSDADQLLAETLLRLRRANEAIAVLTKGMAARPDSRTAIRLSQLEIAAGDKKKGVAVLTNWLAKHPDDHAVRRQYAGSLLALGDAAAARKEYEAVLKQRPEDPMALNDLAWIIQKEDPARAMSMATQAAKIAPHSAEIADTLGWLKFQRSDKNGALSDLQRARKLNDDNPVIGYHLAVVLDATGKRAEAKALLQSVLAKNANFTDAAKARELVARW